MVVGLLFPSDQQSSEAVQPTGRALHLPAPRLVRRVAKDVPGLLGNRPDVAHETQQFHQPLHEAVIVSLVQAQVLRRGRGIGPRDRPSAERLGQKLAVVDVGRGHHQVHRDAVALNEQREFGAALGPVDGAGPGFFPPRAGPW